MSENNIPHIIIDAAPLVTKRLSGKGHYTLGIVSSFDELAAEGKINYSLVISAKKIEKLKKYGLNHYNKLMKNPFPRDILRTLLKWRCLLPMDWLFGKGYYYFPTFTAWPLWSSQGSVVIYDVTYLEVPNCVTKSMRQYLKKITPISLARASTVITVSEFSKSEIIKHYHVHPEKIYVIKPAVNRKLFYKRSEVEINQIKVKYGISSDHYFLSVGNIEPRKNYLRLIDAYTSLPKQITDHYSLVIIGAESWNNEAIIDKIETAKRAGYNIIQPKTFVPNKDLPALYSGASIYIFVPIYEGFGMSPMEAYACGTPVIASETASVPEAAGKAAMYVDPYDVEAIADKIQRMLSELAQNPKKFHSAMEAELKSKSWRAAAEMTIAAMVSNRCF